MNACAIPTVGVIVIRGEGRAFAAGADASPSGAMRDRSANTNREELLDELWGRFQCLWDAPKPVIAQVHGYCLGAGTDSCAASPTSWWSPTTARSDGRAFRLGGGVEDVLFAFYVGARKAKEYAFQTATRIDGREANEVGWANRSVPADQLHDTVQRMAERMARTPPGLLRLKKESINRVVDQMGFRDAVRVERGVVRVEPHRSGRRGGPRSTACARHQSDDCRIRIDDHSHRPLLLRCVNARLSIFNIAVIGNASTTRNASGNLNFAMCSAPNARNSSSCGGSEASRGITTATPIDPMTASGRPTTVTCATLGCHDSTCSASFGKIT